MSNFAAKTRVFQWVKVPRRAILKTSLRRFGCLCVDEGTTHEEVGIRSDFILHEIR